MIPVRDKLRLIALKAREWAEGNRGHCPPSLEMMCARASGELFKKLKRAGYKPELVFIEFHCFVVCEGYIIDITATQYNYTNTYDRVEIVPWTSGRKNQIWKGPIRFRTENIKVAKEHQAKTGWPKNQWVLA